MRPTPVVGVVLRAASASAFARLPHAIGAFAPVASGGWPEALRLDTPRRRGLESPSARDPLPAASNRLVEPDSNGHHGFFLGTKGIICGSPPFTPGADAAGTRVDTGECVLVTGAPGAYAELLAAPAENVWPIPDSLDSARAAALGVAYKTALASQCSCKQYEPPHPTTEPTLTDARTVLPGPVDPY